MQDSKSISGPPSRKPRRSRRPFKSSKDLPMRLGAVFAETLEQVQFDWPEYLAVERIRIGIAEIGATMVVLAVLTVLARWTIFALVR
jgi:hypothetical protein